MAVVTIMVAALTLPATVALAIVAMRAAVPQPPLFQPPTVAVAAATASRRQARSKGINTVAVFDAGAAAASCCLGAVALAIVVDSASMHAH